MYSTLLIFAIISGIDLVPSATFHPNSTLKPSNRESRISHGNNARINGFPFAVSITGYQENFTSRCVGSILTPNVILTAAHCFQFHSDLSWYIVRAGSDFADVGDSTNYIRNIIIHPDFNTRKKDNDLAVLQLENPIELDNVTKKSIEMFESGENIRDGTTATTAGWGELSPKIVNYGQLQSLDLRIVSKNNCSKTFENYFKNKYNASLRLHEGLICATSSTGDELQSFCGGDSGGPLIVDNKLAGIVSFSKKDCTSKPLPNVFTEIAYYRDWIDEMVAEYTIEYE